ncbi:GNAT family N-acetyltransferase [candidate division WOR-3 bacterium]|nr:GNAT family N-acetyltransferase [candidate division WOR-3 bacterium]
MKILLDTNILIAAEPTALDEIEPTTENVALLLNATQVAKYGVYIHPASNIDLNKDKNEQRRKARQVLLEKYCKLNNPPVITDDIRRLIGSDIAIPDPVDHHLLAAVYRDAIDYLVTEDRGIHKKARRLGVQDRVLTIDAMFRTIRGLSPVDIEPPPAVEHVFCYELDENDPIFNTFRDDYPEFDKWFKKCKREHRSARIIYDSNKKYAGIAIIKDENDQPYGLMGRVLKLCSFKVADRAVGKGLSELLLETVLDFAFVNGYDCTYVEVLPKYGGLLHFLNLFGFEDVEQLTKRGEFVVVKNLTFSKKEYRTLDPLCFHIKYGPRYIKLEGIDGYIVPIQPQYHGLLFPEVQEQLLLMPGLHAFGNAIRKAYLCNSAIKKLAAGSLLLFYRSHDKQSVQCIGVVEKTTRSCDPSIIERFVGPRTVYSSEEIVSLCTKDVLAINFRCARSLSDPLPLKQLKAAHIITAPPQSITKISTKGLEWFQKNIQK